MRLGRIVNVTAALVLFSSMAFAQASPAKIKGTEYFDPGVVWYTPKDKDKIASELEKVKADGYKHIAISSWMWTLPSPGSDLRENTDFLLDWCDKNGIGVLLHHNIQYNEGWNSEYFDNIYVDPAKYFRQHLVDWVDTLKGHSCVIGMELGNEVGIGRVPGDAVDIPHYAEGFRKWVVDYHGSLDKLNAAWGTQYKIPSEIDFPNEKAPGYVDLRRFQMLQFGRFYGELFDKVVKPELGDNLIYTTKTGRNPYSYRDYPSATVIGWDDLMANYPLWGIKLTADVDPRPSYNSELHLYHDDFQFFPSIELVRYRYLTSVLNGELTTASFSWGSWNKPAIAKIHSQTPDTLKEADRLTPYLQRFHEAELKSRIGVLVTEPQYRDCMENFADVRAYNGMGVKETKHSTDMKGVDDKTAAYGLAYAALGSTGRPWRYVLDLDLSKEASSLDTLVIWTSSQMPARTLTQVLNLPASVKIYWVGPWASTDEYGYKLSAADFSALKKRAKQLDDGEELTDALQDKDLPDFYNAYGKVSYGWYEPQKGHYTFDMIYPRIEARYIDGPDGEKDVLLINHTRDIVTLPYGNVLPWLNVDTMQAIDITGESPTLASPKYVRFGQVADREKTERIVMGSLRRPRLQIPAEG